KSCEPIRAASKKRSRKFKGCMGMKRGPGLLDPGPLLAPILGCSPYRSSSFGRPAPLGATHVFAIGGRRRAVWIRDRIAAVGGLCLTIIVRDRSAVVGGRCLAAIKRTRKARVGGRSLTVIDR